MKDKKIRAFMALAGQEIPEKFNLRDPKTRALGAQLLLSEVLEYVIQGLGVTPVVNGVKITEPNQLNYETDEKTPDQEQMLDGLADTAYTMYWNALAFGLPLEEAFELVCDNNLEKFVKLEGWAENSRPLERSEWGCNLDVKWPPEVVSVEVIQVDDSHYGVGKDKSGKVRKPSSYKPVSLDSLLG